MKEINRFKSIDQIVQYGIKLLDEEREARSESGYWHASELGGCKRKHFFRFTKVPKCGKESFSSKMVMKEGEGIHFIIQEALEKTGLLFRKEEVLKDESLKLKGRFDGLVEMSGKNLVLMDIKTQKTKVFERRQKLAINDKIDEYLKKQLTAYFLMLKKKYPNISRSAHLYFVDRGEGAREEFVVKITKKLEDSVLEELKELNEAVDKNKIPLRTDKKWQCPRCPWESHCKKVDFNLKI